MGCHLNSHCQPRQFNYSKGCGGGVRVVDILIHFHSTNVVPYFMACSLIFFLFAFSISCAHLVNDSSGIYLGQIPKPDLTEPIRKLVPEDETEGPLFYPILYKYNVSQHKKPGPEISLFSPFNVQSSEFFEQFRIEQTRDKKFVNNLQPRAIYTSHPFEMSSETENMDINTVPQQASSISKSEDAIATTGEIPKKKVLKASANVFVSDIKSNNSENDDLIMGLENECTAIHDAPQGFSLKSAFRSNSETNELLSEQEFKDLDMFPSENGLHVPLLSSLETKYEDLYDDKKYQACEKAESSFMRLISEFHLDPEIHQSFDNKYILFRFSYFPEYQSLQDIRNLVDSFLEEYHVTDCPYLLARKPNWNGVVEFFVGNYRGREFVEILTFYGYRVIWKCVRAEYEDIPLRRKAWDEAWKLAFSEKNIDLCAMLELIIQCQWINYISERELAPKPVHQLITEQKNDLKIFSPCSVRSIKSKKSKSNAFENSEVPSTSKVNVAQAKKTKLKATAPPFKPREEQVSKSPSVMGERENRN